MPRSLPYELTVKKTDTLTPNMQRIVLTGDDLKDFPQGQEGGYVKLLFPIAGDRNLPSIDAIEAGAPVIMRTYTVRSFNTAKQEITIDFVLHGDGGHSGPASKWARTTKAGDTMVMYGPGAVKPVNFSADWFLLAGDMTALPAISSQLERLPNTATGYAVIEINDENDKQELKAPQDMNITWVVNSQTHHANTVLSDAVKNLPWLEGKPSIWAACEFSNMRLLRAYFKKDRNVARDELYVSSYWKMGQTEDKHKVTKKLDAQLDAATH